MRRFSSFLVIGICLGITVQYAPADGGMGEVTKVLGIMPADFVTALVVRDLEELDQSISAWRGRLDPNYKGASIVADIKRDLPIGDWIDFSKPIGIAAPSLGGQEWDVVFWARAPEFAVKVKALNNATEEEGVWLLPFDGKGTVFAKLRGDYVVAAMSREMLTRATKQGKSLADEMRSRKNLLEKRDVLIHLNIEPVRPMALGGIAQASQMMPMLVMLAGQQGGADPAALTGLFTAMFDAAKQFVEQIAYIDVTLAVSREAADATIATGYKEGAIKTYLTMQRASSIPLLTHIEEQPYLVAAGYHVPGEKSPFFDYIFDRTISAIRGSPVGLPATPRAAEPDGGPSAAGVAADGKTSGIEKAIRVARQLYHSIEGLNMVMAMSPGGMRVSGNYVGKNPQTLLGLVKESLTSANPAMKQLGAGVKYETLGSKRIGGLLVDRFAIKLDTTNPSAAMMATMYGENPRFSVAVVGGRVGFCMGGDTYVERFFSGNVEKPFVSGRLVKEALGKLPAKRNAVMLLDPAAGLSMIGPMLGMQKMDAVPPGPPVAISVSLAGDPARLDIHVPLRAIERLIQAFAPDEPM